MFANDLRLIQVRPRRWLLAWAFGCAAAFAALAAPTGVAQTTTQGANLERSVKAAFLYKFLSYTEFPASAFAEPGSPVVIGVAGSDDMAAELSRLVAGRSVNNRPIAVKAVHDAESSSGVHLLFIAGADSARLLRMLRPALQNPMLLVTESDNGLQNGSVINFKIVEERVRFDVSLEAADRYNVRLSSRLLTVANHVQKGTP